MVPPRLRLPPTSRISREAGRLHAGGSVPLRDWEKRPTYSRLLSCAQPSGVMVPARPRSYSWLQMWDGRRWSGRMTTKAPGAADTLVDLHMRH